MKRGILVFNPAAGGPGSALRMKGVVERARLVGVELEEHPTTAPGTATAIVAAALRSAPDLIVVAGGDGTVGEAAAALAGTSTPLAILPYGTANVLARECGIGASPRRAERFLASRKTRAITAWIAAERVCCMWMGVGLDARMMKSVQPALKRGLGRTGIAWTAVGDFLRYDFPPIRVDGIDPGGGRFRHEATFVVAANIQRYGGEMKIAPSADPEDELLDLVLFTGTTKAALMRFLVDIAMGRMGRADVPNVIRLRAREMTAHAVGPQEVDVQVDGDFVGTTPATIGPVVGRVNIVVPE